MRSEAQRRADAKYKRNRMKAVTIRFSPNELDLFEHLYGQANKQGYIKALIRADMLKDTQEFCP